MRFNSLLIMAPFQWHLQCWMNNIITKIKITEWQSRNCFKYRPRHYCKEYSKSLTLVLSIGPSATFNWKLSSSNSSSTFWKSLSSLSSACHSSNHSFCSSNFCFSSVFLALSTWTGVPGEPGGIPAPLFGVLG